MWRKRWLADIRIVGSDSPRRPLVIYAAILSGIPDFSILPPRPNEERHIDCSPLDWKCVMPSAYRATARPHLINLSRRSSAYQSVEDLRYNQRTGPSRPIVLQYVLSQISSQMGCSVSNIAARAYCSSALHPSLITRRNPAKQFSPS